ncbi:contactin-associated protein-like 2b [Takifugu flavidus]|uniref:Contactin-associated protein-like 2 n=1 Tax=Takifugu flavidus TaxID=433684 RepID=A0A5C6P2U0_9TELE|nr:contactin-associated protein-like 2b [Takifugu flavidus]TWW73428.1 Contactin-associated protein-like 2 [Takifugu flavidus]
MFCPSGLFWVSVLWSIIGSCSPGSSASRKCENSLATPLPYSSFTSSSVYAGGYGAGYAKLNRKQGAGGWSPLDTDHYQWLQVDLGSRKEIVGIATQGRYSSSDWTRKYQLIYSDTPKNWRPYLQDGNIWTFEGNKNSEEVVRHELQHAILARYVRFIPVDWSREGRIGVRLELYGCSYWADVISFDGHSVISYRFRSKKMKILKDVISLKFRTSSGNGVLLHGEGQQGDYISLELRRARLQLSINLGSNQYGSIQGHTTVTSGSLLDDDHWHSVVIERYRRNVNFTLDHHTQHFRTNGEFDHLDLDYEISFGGMSLSLKPSSGGRDNFVGCMEGLTYNNDNITNMVRRKKVDTSSFSNLTFSCAESNSFSVFFNSTSFVKLPGQSDSDTLSVSLSFRTWNPSGLLMFTTLADGWVEVDLSEGKVIVYVTLTEKKNMRIDISSGSGLNDGQWHSVHLNVLENHAMLTVDGDEASTVRTAIPTQIQTGGTYYFGGYFLHTNTRSPQWSFQGCMQMIHIDDYPADLRAVEQGLIGTFENVSLDMCAIIDRCVPNPCEHGGYCSQTWDMFTCNCSGTGYTGATCHASMYQQSCEEYKHQGKSSGSYWIDPDGSGPVAAFQVTCNMTGEKVWTTLKNNVSPQTPVINAEKNGKAVLWVAYNVTDEQMLSVTSSAEYCEQYVAYACRMSRLLNSPDGVPFTWWIGRANERHSYWGGSGPGIQKCSCGIEHNCTDPKHYCNCDADLRAWREDAGLLVYKDHLPVNQVVVGDMSRGGSEAKLTVGPLRCRGDRNFWNAASFSSPASYLHFPSFRGETSTDISFYFKTSSTHGVFLENLGVKDFLRIELRGGSVVLFSFDVGDERVELSVHSPQLLNDDKWHRVEVEKNIQEAALHIDGEYKEVRPSSPQGHTKLEFYTDLYVGASSGQRGFLGCMRALKINGVPFNLKAKAEMSPGVSPGCQGHCSSYGTHCQNGGMCVEKYNGYTCDCSLTAYDGPFCTEDVGGYFETGTLVRYDFLPEVANFAVSEMKNQAGIGFLNGANLTQEELVFSFSTSTTPSILVYISSRTQDYIAVVLKHNGTLQIRYSLGGLSEPYTIDLHQRNIANGQPHSVNVTRNLREIRLQLDHYPVSTYLLPEESDTYFNLVKSIFLGKVFETGQIDPILIERYNTPGFVGCLSRVQFNSVAPLKAALRSGQGAPVSTHGILVPSNCGASPLTISPMSSAADPWHFEAAGVLFPFNEDKATDNEVDRNSAIVGGIISMVVFTVVCIMVFVVRHLFRHKGSYHTNEAKGADSADCADAAIIVSDPAFTETIEESKKEWFI